MSGSDALAATVERLAADLAALTDHTITLLRAELPSYADVPADSLQPAVRRYMDRAVRTLRSGTPPVPAETDEAEIVTRDRVRQGVPVEDMMRAIRIGSKVVQDRLIGIASELRVPSDVLLDGIRLLTSLGDAFTARVAVEYQEFRVNDALHEAHRRSDFLGALLSGTLGEAELVSQSALYGIDTSASYAAIRARDDGRTASEELRHRLERSGSLPGQPALVGLLGKDCAGIVAGRPTAPDSVVVGIGRAVPLRQIADSFRTASRVLEVACRLNRVGVLGVDDLSWRLSAAADPEVSSHLVDRYLAPLHEQGEFGQVLEDTVRAYLGNGQNVARAAAHLKVHGNTLRYRLGKFAELTGASLTSTDAVIEVAWALELGRGDGADLRH